MLLHLPIGMLVALIALEVLALVRLFELPSRARASLAWLIFLVTAASIASGLLLEREPAYTGGETLNLHKWIGIALGVLTAFTAISLCSARLRKLYPLFLLLSVAAMFPAGHLGASMTHGEGFLTEPFTARAATPDPMVPVAARGPYSGEIAPLLARYCISCHGDSKQKGKLALHTPEAILLGGVTGSAIEPGDPDNSEIIYRLRLPAADRDRMPPKDKPQPTEAEIAAIEAWIAAGANFEAVDAAPIPAEKPDAPEQRGELGATALPPPPAAAIAAIRAHQAHIELIDPDSGLYWVSFNAAPTTTDADAAKLLAPLTDHIADLSLAGTTITDRALPQVAAMPRLRRLSLARTATTAAGLALLSNLPELEELNLTETQLNDAAAATELASGFPRLVLLFAWRSGLTDSSIATLAAARPELRIESAAAAAQPLETEPPLTFSGDAPPPPVPAPPAAATPPPAGP
jgi:uncharacterized membrane protein/mono/diheme cytochrome c family protein